MALVEGTNCGFVLVAPSADPEATAGTHDNYALAGKFTSPAGAAIVTEIGFYCPTNPDAGPGFEACIYTHDVANDDPEAIVGSKATGTLTNGTGWKKFTGLNIAISSSTIYWIATQVDNTTPATQVDYQAAVGEKYCYQATSTLTDPYVASSSFTRFIAIYAVYTTAPAGGGQMTTMSKFWGP